MVGIVPVFLPAVVLPSAVLGVPTRFSDLRRLRALTFWRGAVSTAEVSASGIEGSRSDMLNSVFISIISTETSHDFLATQATRCNSPSGLDNLYESKSPAPAGM